MVLQGGELRGLLHAARRPRQARRDDPAEAADHQDRQVHDDLVQRPDALPDDGRVHRRDEADHRGARRRDDGARRVGGLRAAGRQELPAGAVLHLQGDRPDRGPQGAQQRLLRRPALDGPRRRQPAGQARPRAQVRLDHGRHGEPQVRVDQEHRVLHRQDPRLDGRRPDADADRARPARPLRGALPLVLGPVRALPGRARRASSSSRSTSRASARTTWPATATTSSAS